MSPTNETRRNGYTIAEVGIALAIVAVALVLGLPRLNQASENAELRETALALDGGLAIARAEAIRTGDVQLFFLFQDAEGNTLTDSKGEPVPVLIVNDGAPGSPRQNCRIDPGEKKLSLDGERLKKVAQVGGPPPGAGQAGVDMGRGEPGADGSSFEDPSGNAATWLMFRPEGIPVAFDGACSLGTLGSGAGTFYLSNEDRAFAISVSPMGTTKVSQYNASLGAWKD